MYDLIDRPVETLPAFEQGILMRLRRWVHAMSSAGAATAPDAADAFGDAMRLLDEGSSDDLHVLRPCHSTVGECEAVLVALWRLARSGSERVARDVAGGLVDAARADRLVLAVSASLAD